jgi:hypothetical protein
MRILSNRKIQSLLCALLDYQRFDPNAHLDQVLHDAAKQEENGTLNDDDLAQLSAAGETKLDHSERPR